MVILLLLKYQLQEAVYLLVKSALFVGFRWGPWDWAGWGRATILARTYQTKYGYESHQNSEGKTFLTKYYCMLVLPKCSVKWKLYYLEPCNTLLQILPLLCIAVSHLHDISETRLWHRNGIEDYGKVNMQPTFHWKILNHLVLFCPILSLVFFKSRDRIVGKPSFLPTIQLILSLIRR